MYNHKRRTIGAYYIDDQISSCTLRGSQEEGRIKVESLKYKICITFTIIPGKFSQEKLRSQKRKKKCKIQHNKYTYILSVRVFGS